LGRVGLTETEARAQGRSIRVAKMLMNYVARALEVDETRGFMKAVVDADTGQILGYACLGIEGGELMNMVEIAMLGKVPYTVLKEAIFAHPTLGESLNNLFMDMDAA
jgi:pyruvate/2-oxoglutarate dehydrogenase complex dihydrolipoamide dehydrogenase (E3) component